MIVREGHFYRDRDGDIWQAVTSQVLRFTAHGDGDPDVISGDFVPTEIAQVNSGPLVEVRPLGWGGALMARRMVGDEQDMYRVVVIRRRHRDNPDWKRGVIGPGNDRLLFDGAEYTSTYGPYNSIGAARGQLTFHTLDTYGEPGRGVVRGWIEKARTTWEVVE
ncbi:hypothetical protein AB0A77_01985 [Streptomyces varsoviensis]|uniref:hypothetical protein n=1 Tax=Streptomyces varsoviensis TaxID=67373 RepID=UPI0033CD349A